MPGLPMDVVNGIIVSDEQNQNSSPYKEGFTQQSSPRSPLSRRSPHSDSLDLAIDGVIDTSIEQLYHNVCEMESSDMSPSMPSMISYGEESRIDSELRHLIGDIEEMEMTKEVVAENKGESNNGDLTPQKENKTLGIKSSKKNNNQTLSAKRISHLQPEGSARSSPRSNSSHGRPEMEKRNEKINGKSNVVFPRKKRENYAFGAKFQNVMGDLSEEGLDNPDLGRFLLEQTRNMISAGEKPQRALEVALRAVKSFEVCENGKPDLERVMSLHVLAAIHCSLGQYNEAIPVLERSIEVPVIEDGQDHALAKFAGCMQLGDTYAMLGQIENSILCYTAGLEIQRQVLGEIDPRVGETCRYVAEAHVQALQFDDAEKICQMALDIHRENGAPASLEEAADRRLMGLICDSKGDYEAALEHYVLASMAMASSGTNELDVASIDCSIGDAYLSLARYDEAIFAYQKGLTVFKANKGENHPSVASVYVRLADLYNRIGKFRDSKSYCENALRIYGKPNPGIPSEEIASGLIDVSAIYQSMNELDQALRLLKKALKIYGDAAGQQSTIAGIEAQMGVMYYMMGNYSDSYSAFKNAISKFRESGEKKSALFGIALNQMGLACVQRYAINEAADMFEEARSILEKEYGLYHPDTLGVYSNLAGTYDAMGRLDEAIEILEQLVGMREEKLGTANPDVHEEKRRLAELLKEAGRVRSRKSRSLEKLLDANSLTK
ncbi:Tetratricopeptide repeat-like superfamily protein [Tripterygium wilfordii]|uniref:Tetratricopeptide repeat-like superfamily protein n=1 Tax=Tripterygium wilfordii TaxID=458696 RepID=A0A7J7D215_TRIWF|nr:protein KINESIN LIGHT CHAIN-RELATED 2 [Tripterygium wilfordii]XP_038715992.1 protein KINESIN LIGHT CHAIN-RELATED 2 [Tripterygium wilfordii]XP_038715993.1 protein KINESIN LIGHT CHAIN-RELATED 2 [Tripterygium wilfordii]KAF5740370.1 Tetratricopeptide repeat-like superfamily protein [Tripterygium wilfordii]